MKTEATVPTIFLTFDLFCDCVVIDCYLWVSYLPPPVVPTEMSGMWDFFTLYTSTVRLKNLNELMPNSK